MEKFDIIVVGAGPAGATAGMVLARGGLNALVVERGSEPGAKNVSGGLLYSAGITDIYPSFWTQAPLERPISTHKLVMLGERGSTALDVQTGETTPATAYSVLRARLDPWLAAQAEQAGATVLNGVNADALLMEGDRVVGIQAGPDQIGANVVVIAEGTAALLQRQAGLQKSFDPHEVSLGVKEIVALPSGVIEDRFGCDPGSGAAYTLVGSTAGVDGGGFIYTNRATLSVGVVVKIDSLARSGLHPYEVLDAFKAHPLVARLVRDGEVVEYSAQTVHRGGFHLASQLVGNGYVVVGSAARLLVNNVLTLRGMDFAMISGAIAAQSIIEAHASGTFDARALATYPTRLRQTSIYRDWRTFRGTYDLMDNPRLFSVYPDLAGEILHRLVSPSSEPTPKALKIARSAMRGKVSMLRLVRDLVKVARGVAL
jgi:electron transfer flavoprotein-quinone oxidoreductase